jgi:hypothetical protein
LIGSSGGKPGRWIQLGHRCAQGHLAVIKPEKWELKSLASNFTLSQLCGLVVRVPGYWSRGSGLDSRLYQIFWEVVGLEQRPLSLVSKIGQLLGKNSSGPGLENREYGRGDPLCWPCDILYRKKLALTSPASVGRSVSIVCSQTKATGFVYLCLETVYMIVIQ